MDLDFEGEGMFYPNTFDVATKQHIKLSEYWPLVLGVHYAMGGQAYCAMIKKEISTGRIIRVDMVDKTGLQRVAIYEKDDAFNIHPAGTEGLFQGKDPLVKSKNSRYILNKINNDENGITQKLREIFMGSDKRVKLELHVMMGHLLRALRPPNVCDGGLNAEAARMLTLNHFGHSLELPASIKTNIQSSYDKYIDLQDNYNNCMKAIGTLVEPPKWLFAAYDKTLYCGAYRLNVMDDVQRFAGRNAFTFEYRSEPEAIHPLRAYHSKEDINPEFREQAMAAWTIFKLYAEKHSANIAGWVNSFVPEVSAGYLRRSDAGAIVWSNGHIKYMLLDMPQ